MIYVNNAELEKIFGSSSNITFSTVQVETYPKDCIKAKEEYYKEIEDRLRKKYNYETEDENRVKDKLKEILKEQSSRYKGKVKIKILD